MANNTHVNKVVYNDSTLIDLTGDTVTPESLLSGYTAHDRSGAPINGSAVIPTKISDLQDDVGYLVENDIVNNLTSTATDKPGSANMLKTLNDNLTNVDHKNVFTYVVAFNKTQTSAGNWTDGGITFPVSSGDRVTMDIMATGTGQMTRSAIGSSGHVYYNDGPNISNYEHGGRFIAFTVGYNDTSITISSYANSAITVRTAVVTVTSKY